MAVLGNVKLVAYGFVPRDWAACDGQLLSIAENSALFAVIGTTYGGDGRNTFGLPNLQTRVPIHESGAYREGSSGGSATVTLTVSQMPEHTHPIQATESGATGDEPTGKVLATSPRGVANYVGPDASALVNMEPHSMDHAGGGQAHDNMQPYQALQYIICTNGTFPSRDGALPLEEEDWLADVKTFGFGFAPRGWATCDGQLMPIQGNESLYSLLGTTYGGNGRTTFGLPDLRGRVAAGEGTHAGVTLTLGEKAGTEEVTLSAAEIPSHDHQMELCNKSADQAGPGGAMLAGSPNVFTDGDPEVDLDGSSVGAPGPNGQPHSNMMPFQVVNYCISLTGLFPSRN